MKKTILIILFILCSTSYARIIETYAARCETISLKTSCILQCREWNSDTMTTTVVNASDCTGE